MLAPDRVNVPAPDLVRAAPLITPNIVLVPLLVILAYVTPPEAKLIPRFAFNVTPSASDNVIVFAMLNWLETNDPGAVPKLESLLIDNVPWAILVLPVKVFGPLKVRILVPDLVKLPPPEITPLKVRSLFTTVVNVLSFANIIDPEPPIAPTSSVPSTW